MRRALTFRLLILLTLTLVTRPGVYAQLTSQAPSEVRIIADSVANTISSGDTLRNAIQEIDSLTLQLNRSLRLISIGTAPKTEKLSQIDSIYSVHQNALRTRLQSDSVAPLRRKHFEKVDSVLTSRKQLVDSLRNFAPGNLPLNLDNQQQNLSPGNLNIHSSELNLEQIQLPPFEELALSPEISLDGLGISNFSKDVSIPSDLKVGGEAIEVMVADKVNLPATETKLPEMPVLADVSIPELPTNVSLEDVMVTDPFEGKEEMLKKDLGEIGKIIQKYGEVKDSRFLPKRPPNTMKGKAFLERLVSGCSFQVFHGQLVLLDIGPSLGYRITGHLTMGIGGYKRIGYSRENDALKRVPVYGLRLHGTFMVKKGIYAYLEFERSRPQLPFYNGQLQVGNWDSKLNFGAMLQQKITKKWYAHTLIMYDIIKAKQFPNTSGASGRFGFSYRFKKTKRESSINRSLHAN